MSDEQLRAIQERVRADAKAAGVDRLFTPAPMTTTKLVDDLALVAATSGPEPETWEPPCTSCGQLIGYRCKRGTYCGAVLCSACSGKGLASRLAASGISHREIAQPLSALKNHDPDGKPYGADYDRWLEYLQRFAALRPGERLDPPFAFAYGSNGIGKSAGAERALRDAIANGCAGRVVTFRELVRKVVSTYGGHADESTESLVRLYTSVHLLVIQEVGMEDPTEHNYGLFFDFVDERWRACLPTIFTSNYSPDVDGLGEVMTQRMAEPTKMHAILDRIRGGVGANVFLLVGKSWRGREVR